MLYRSLSVAIILLLSWFAFTSMQSTEQLSLQLNKTNLFLSERAELSVSVQQATDKKIAEIQAYITSQNILAKQKKQVEIKLNMQSSLTRFHATYSKVLRAELLRVDKQYAPAAKLLKSTKKDIWKAGDIYVEKQKILRGLMPKIDALVSAWGKSDPKASAKSIYLVLDKIIQQKG